MAVPNVGFSLGATGGRHRVDRALPGVSYAVSVYQLADRATCASWDYLRRQLW
jgi:hypothetical protein